MSEKNSWTEVLIQLPESVSVSKEGSRNFIFLFLKKGNLKDKKTFVHVQKVGNSLI
jgi:hypothetical protein